MLHEEAVEMWTAYLLLALEHPHDAHRKLAVNGLVGVDRVETRDDVALGVGHATTKHLVVAHHRLEWLGRPFCRVSGGLHVVVVIDEDGGGTLRACAGDNDGETL